MDKNKKKKDDFVRMASKTHPGHFYLFNKGTGDTQWLPIKKFQKIQAQKKESPPKLTINKKLSKTPAQDRLKRLQHNLKSCQTKSHTSQTKHIDTNFKANEQENRIEDEPSTSSAAKSFTQCSKIESKKSLAVTFSNHTDNLAKDLTPSVSEVPKKLDSSNSLKASLHSIPAPTSTKESAIFETCKEVLSTKESTTNNKADDLQINDDDNSSKLNNLRSGIVKKIKEICKLPFQMSKNLSEKKFLSKDEKSSTNFKATRSKTKLKQGSSTSAKQEAIIALIRGENGKSENNSFTNTLKLDTPNNTPSYPRGSANSRLQRLKQSLLLQQHEQSQPYNTTTILGTSNQILNFSSEENNKTSPTTSLPLGNYTNHNNFTHSTNHIANDTTNDDIEIMDWQPMSQDEQPIEESSPEPTFIIRKSKKLLLRKNNSNESQIMGDIIDTVNENLLRLSAERQKDSTNNGEIWRKDFYYFIVDTNVLLRDLTFVEDLSKMKLCDTSGSMLYIPYSVLQELDKLKMRSGFQEGVKTRAVHAIKYLNSKFEKNSPHLHAQSALDERLHLIDINSADDSIINCCLQVKQHVKNLLLLTEDVNLRNKAICNNINVSTKSDLTSKRYETDSNS